MNKLYEKLTQIQYSNAITLMLVYRSDCPDLCITRLAYCSLRTMSIPISKFWVRPYLSGILYSPVALPGGKPQRFVVPKVAQNACTISNAIITSARD